MKTSWTLLAVLVIGWSYDVQCRSIDVPSSSPSAIIEQQKATSDALDTAAEILTLEVVGEAVNATLESQVQAEATAKEQAIAQIIKLAETKAIEDIIADAASSTPSTSGIPQPSVNDEILTVKAIGDAVDKKLESDVQSEANANQRAIAEIMKLAEMAAIRGVLNENMRQRQNLPPSSNLNIPIPTLDFETGSGDHDNEISGNREKRTVAQISRYATCLFTILVNPNCFNDIRNSGGGGSTARAGGGLFAGLLGGGLGGARSTSSSRSSSRQEAYNRQLRQWMEYQKRQIAKLNATEGGNYTTPFPILPPSPPPPSDDEDTTPRPQGFIGRFIQWKTNMIPNLFRTVRSLFSSILPFLQNLGGNRGGGGGGGGGLASLFGGLGGGGSSSGFGNNNYESSGSSYRPSSSSSLSSSSSSGGSDTSSAVGSTAETSTYRISLG